MKTSILFFLLAITQALANTLGESAPPSRPKQLMLFSANCSGFISSLITPFVETKSTSHVDIGRRRRLGSLRRPVGSCRCSVPRSAATEVHRRSELESTNQGKDNPKESRRARKKRLERLQYLRRRARFARRYGSLRALQATFGRGPPGGDLSPRQTRALYHALLPRALLSLRELDLLGPEELAPLAYEARAAARAYARSRCVWTGRIATALFDQYRSVRDRGRPLGPGASASASWEDLWDKYEERIVAEEHGDRPGIEAKEGEIERGEHGVHGKELANRIYMRILERSCATNEAFDRLFLVDDEEAEDGNDLAAIARQLDDDVRTILLTPKEGSKAMKSMEKKKKEQEKREKDQRKAELRARKKAEKAPKKTQLQKEDKK